MSFLTEVGTAVMTGGVSAITGGIFGFLSTGVKAWSDYKNRQLDMEQQREKWGHDERMMDRTVDLQKYQAEIEKDVKTIDAEKDIIVSGDQLRGEALRAAEQRLGPQVQPLGGMTGAVLGFLYGIADFATKMIRPVITVFAAYYFHLLWEWAQEIGKQAVLSPEQAYSLQYEILTSTIFLSTGIISFWFGMRSIQAPAEKLFGAATAKKK